MAREQKKILYTIHRFWPHPGGSERLVASFARRSAKSGHDVTVFTTNAWEPDSYHKPARKRLDAGIELHDGLKIRRFPIRNIPLQFKVLGSVSLLPVDALRLLFDYPHILLPEYLDEIFINQPRFDLIVAGVLPYGQLIYPAAWLARRLGAPWICLPLLHTGEDGRPPRGYLTAPQVKLMKQADAIITLTEAENETLIDCGINPGRISTLGVGVDADEVLGGDGLSFRERYKISGPIVLQISTQTREKGSCDLVEAMKRLWAAGSKASLVLIGQMTEEFEDYFLAQPPSVYERAICLGFVDEQTKKDALAACDVFAMPSRAESFGSVYLEAWLYKKPVIGADAGGVPYVIEDGSDGLLVKFGDTAAIAESIRRLLEDAELRQQMGERGSVKALAHYKSEHICDRMSEVIESLLAR